MRDSSGSELVIVPLTGVRWRAPEHSSWCGAGTRNHLIEAYVLSCDDVCVSLVRVWFWDPCGLRKPVDSVELEVRSGSLKNSLEIKLERWGSYWETPATLVATPGPCEISVLGMKEIVLSLPDCAASPPLDKPAALPLDSPATLVAGWVRHGGRGGWVDILEVVEGETSVLLARAGLSDPSEFDSVRLIARSPAGRLEVDLGVVKEGISEAIVLVLPGRGWVIECPEVGVEIEIHS